VTLAVAKARAVLASACELKSLVLLSPLSCVSDRFEEPCSSDARRRESPETALETSCASKSATPRQRWPRRGRERSGAMRRQPRGREPGAMATSQVTETPEGAAEEGAGPRAKDHDDVFGPQRSSPTERKCLNACFVLLGGGRSPAGRTQRCC